MQQTATRQVWRSADTANVASGPVDGAGQGGAAPTGAVYVPDERIPVIDAVRAYTQGSAYAAFSDKLVGTLDVGKLADLVVLSQDIFTVAPDTVGKTKVIMTLVGGKSVYGAPP
jgi:predicted amidohydrolase YtcJ